MKRGQPTIAGASAPVQNQGPFNVPLPAYHVDTMRSVPSREGSETVTVSRITLGMTIRNASEV